MDQTVKMINKRSMILDDVKVDVKVKIAALWATVLFLFAYGDIFGFFRPGLIEEIIAGRMAGNQIDQVFLLGTTLYVTIPCLMVALSLLLKPNINRPANIVLGILYTASILLFCIGETYAYYLFLSILESALLMLAVWYAWKWPKHEQPVN